MRRYSVFVMVVVLASACGGTPSVPATPTVEPTPAPSFTIHFFDVGQGDATLITANGHGLLIDGGRSSSTVVQRLNSVGVTSLDAIVATHPDADHVGGLAAVLGAYPVARIYVNGDPSTTQTYDEFLSAAAREPGAEVLALTRGQSVPLGGLLLPVLNPPSPSGDTNNDSIVLELTCGSVSVLFTGDAEAPVEQSMMAAGLITHVNVLKVGHHGSNTASSQAFVDVVRPEVAVISAGKTNAFGHPHPETLARLASVGALFEYTDTTAGDDSVTMTSNCTRYAFSTPPTAATPVPLTSPTPTATP